MKSIQQVLILHSFQGCSDVRDRCYIMHGFCFYHYFNFIILGGPSNSQWDYILGNKRKSLLCKNISFPYNVSVPGFLLETWWFDQKQSMLDALEGTKIAQSALLSPSSEDPSPLTAVLWTVCLHWLWRVESVPLNGRQWKPLCQVWRNFLLSIRTTLDHHLWEPNVSHVSEGIGLQNGDFFPLSDPWLALGCFSCLFVTMILWIK